MDCVFFNKCKERLDRISDSMIHANQAFSVYMQMRNFQEEHNELINISPGFYRCVFSCCVEVLFIEINKMFDPDPSSDGILGLLNSMKRSIDLLDREKPIAAGVIEKIDGKKWDSYEYENIEQLIDKAIESISQHDKIIYRVKTQRDKFYAHQDKDIKNLNDFFKKHSVSIIDLETLIVLNTNLFNALYTYFKNTTLMPVANNHEDFKKTVYYIEKGVEALRELEG